ncbi:hypothetical protein BGX27_003360 [Mortierella sp. AM989]|nr:hypothetical protein BGX27_003360 [Mortierella sp. AM989]
MNQQTPDPLTLEQAGIVANSDVAAPLTLEEAGIVANLDVPAPLTFEKAGGTAANLEVTQTINNDLQISLELDWVGAEYFYKTDLQSINPTGYIIYRFAIARKKNTRITYQQVTEEWGVALERFKNSKNKQVRDVGFSYRKLSKKFVGETLKAQKDLEPQKHNGSGVDLSGLESPDPTQTDPTRTLGSDCTDATDAESSTSSLRRQFSDINNYISSVDLMRDRFRRNFDTFIGNPLILPSGEVFDKVAFEYAHKLDMQSPLHSFILYYGSDELGDILQCFPSIEDQNELQHLLRGVKSSADKTHTLEAWKIDVINCFKNLYSVEDMMFKGLNNVFGLEEPEPKPEGYREFVKTIVDFMNDILLQYKEYGQELAGQEREIKLSTNELLERDYLTIWGVFFRAALSKNSRLIKFTQGEISSGASATRRNTGRKINSGRQNGGHKLDSILYVPLASDTEFGAVEGGRKNENSYGTKYLTDGMKLAKALKDQFDNACAKAASNLSDVASFKKKIEVYGFLVSGAKLDFVTLRYFGGRFFLFKKISEVHLPIDLHERSFSKIRNILIQFLLIRMRMEETADIFVEYIDGDAGSFLLSSDEQEYTIAPTLTTPPPSPKAKRAKAIDC